MLKIMNFFLRSVQPPNKILECAANYSALLSVKLLVWHGPPALHLLKRSILVFIGVASDSSRQSPGQRRMVLSLRHFLPIRCYPPVPVRVARWRSGAPGRFWHAPSPEISPTLASNKPRILCYRCPGFLAMSPGRGGPRPCSLVAYQRCARRHGAVRCGGVRVSSGPGHVFIKIGSSGEWPAGAASPSVCYLCTATPF